MSDTLKVALVQKRCGPRSEDNLESAVAAVDAAARSGAQVLCLPELFRAPYPCQSEDVARFDLAEPVPGPSTEELGAAAARNRMVIIASLFERRAPGLCHNSAVILDADGKIAGLYRKMHIPDDPGYFEKFYFAPGDLGFGAHETAAGRVGVLVCWDQWFPEAARAVALDGAWVLFYPTAIGWASGEPEAARRRQREAWETIQRGHAIANGMFVAAVNRVGTEEGLEFWGSSFVADPFGEVIARARCDREELMLVECDRTLVETTRRHWPFLRDRRIDAYQDLARRFRS